MTKVSTVVSVDDEPFNLKALVYGEFGSGKTHFAGTASEVEGMGKVLYMRAEHGTFTVTGSGALAVDIKDLKDFDRVYGELAHGGFPDVRTVVFDTGTTFVEKNLEAVVKSNAASSTGNKKTDRPTIRDFGDNNFQLIRRFRELFDLPRHVIVTAHLRETYGTDDEEERIKQGPKTCLPDFPPKLGKRIMAYADFVWSTRMELSGTESTYYLHTQAYLGGPLKRTMWMGKTRGGVFAEALPAKIPNPHFKPIYKLMTKRD